MPGISIIISAYNAQNFIEECLDSIEAQTFFVGNNNYEILLGIDGCFASLNEVARIKAKYRNLRVFYMPENMGVYITFNTLLTYSKKKYILFFGADDIMWPDMISKCMDLGAPLVVRHAGIQFLERNCFNFTGGFMPWRISADSDHLNRLERFYGKIHIADYMYHYRQHPAQLTAMPDTSLRSRQRRTYLKTINEGSNPTFIEPIIHNKVIPFNKLKPMIKKYVGIASFPARHESLKYTIESLINQVDLIYVYLNEYDYTPRYLINPKIRIFHSDQYAGDLGDVGKFYGVETQKGYLFTCDDDLIYAPNYIDFMISEIEKHDRKCVVSLHGRSFTSFPITSYYNQRNEYYPCLKANPAEANVQFPGTGVFAWHSDTISFNIEDFGTINMADIWVAKKLDTAGIPVVVPKHEAAMVKEAPYDRDITIYAACHNNDSIQTEIVNNHNWKSLILAE